MKTSILAGPWIRGAHSMYITPHAGQALEQSQAVVLTSERYWTTAPVPGFDLDLIRERYLAPENVEAWRRRAIALLDDQFVSEGDEAVVLAYRGPASLAKVQGYRCRLVMLEGRRFLQAKERIEIRPAR